MITTEKKLFLNQEWKMDDVECDLKIESLRCFFSFKNKKKDRSNLEWFGAVRSISDAKIASKNFAVEKMIAVVEWALDSRWTDSKVDDGKLNDHLRDENRQK